VCGEHGRAVQVDPIKPMLKAPGTKRLKPKNDQPLSILLQFCFQFQLAPLQHVAGHGVAAHRRERAPGDEGNQLGPGVVCVGVGTLKYCLLRHRHTC